MGNERLRRAMAAAHESASGGQPEQPQCQPQDRATMAQGPPASCPPPLDGGRARARGRAVSVARCRWRADTGHPHHRGGRSAYRTRRRTTRRWWTSWSPPAPGDLAAYAMLFLPETHRAAVRAAPRPGRRPLSDQDWAHRSHLPAAPRTRRRGAPGRRPRRRVRTSLHYLQEGLADCDGIELGLYASPLYSSLFRSTTRCSSTPHLYGTRLPGAVVAPAPARGRRHVRRLRPPLEGLRRPRPVEGGSVRAHARLNGPDHRRQPPCPAASSGGGRRGRPRPATSPD